MKDVIYNGGYRNHTVTKETFIGYIGFRGVPHHKTLTLLIVNEQEVS